MANVTRATYPAPIPRTSLIGADLEEPLKLSFANGTLSGYIAAYDQVASGSLVARRITSTSFTVTLSEAEYSQLAVICSEALARADVVPSGTTWAIVNTTGPF